MSDRQATVLLVTGPAGSGKTTTALEWASTSTRRAAHLSVDDMSLVVKTGRVSGAEQGDEALLQWHLAVAATGAAAEGYAAAGIDCAIDAYLLPEQLDLWSWTAPFDPLIVVLLPDVETAVQRNGRRVESTGWGVPEWQVYANHSAMGAWHEHTSALVIDNSTSTVEEVVAEIRRRCAER